MSQSVGYTKIFCKRLKEARLAAGLSQKKLGIAANIDEFVASTRINRYEKGVHEVDTNTAQNLADVLNVPLAYFYTTDDQLAYIVQRFEKLPVNLRENILGIISSHEEVINTHHS